MLGSSVCRALACDYGAHWTWRLAASHLACLDLDTFLTPQHHSILVQPPPAHHYETSTNSSIHYKRHIRITYYYKALQYPLLKTTSIFFSFGVGRVEHNEDLMERQLLILLNPEEKKGRSPKYRLFKRVK